MKTNLRSLRNRTTRSCQSAHFVKRLSSWLALATALTVVPSDAAEFTWDISGVAGITGGGGTWDFVTTNWTLDGGATNTTWLNNNTAVFSGASGGVVLAGPVTAQGLTFTSTGYDISGSTITLTAPAEISAYLGESATINSKLSGADGLTKTRGGAIRLANTTNDYTGTTTISGGSLIITTESALGASVTPIVVTGSDIRGVVGGSLVLDGSVAPVAITRDLDLQGYGPIATSAGALVSTGNNTLSGAVSMGGTPFADTRMIAADGIINITTSLNVGGTAGTHIQGLGGVNQAGASFYDLTGALTGTGTLEKTGGGTLLLDPSSSAGFSGVIRVSGSAASGQSDVQITSANVLGTRTAAGTGAVLDMNGGILTVLMDAPSVLAGGASANVYGRASSTFIANHAPGSDVIAGTVQFGSFLFEDGQTFTFTSRNGYGISFGNTTVNGGNNNSTFTNNMGGLLTFTGNFWNNNDNGADRTMNLGGNGSFLIDGNLLGSASSFNRNLSKTGTGVLIITGTGSTLDGTVNVQGSLRITDFNSIGTSNTSAITLGSATTTVGNLIIGTSATPSAAGLTTSRPIVLNGTSASNAIYANQTGLDPVILNGTITRPLATTGTVILGGTSTALNVINTSIPAATGTNPGILRKDGPGTWVLAAANAYTGLTTINDGTLRLRADAGVSTILPSANAITFAATNGFAGGALELEGFLDTVTTQNLGALTVTNGANDVRLIPSGTGTANLVFASAGAIADGASVNIVGSNASNTVTLTGAATGLVQRAYFGGSNFAYSNAGVLRAPVYDGVTDGATFVTEAGGATMALGQNNVNITGDITAQATQVLSTVRLDAVGGTRTLTLDAGAVLTVRSGAANTDGQILATGGASVITGGANVTVGGTGSLSIRVDAVSDTLTMSSLMTGFSGGVTKDGDGKLILGGVNAQTGTFNINEGEVELATGGRLGASGVAVTMRQGAVLDLAGITPTTATGSWNNNGTLTNSSATPVTFTVGSSNGTGTSWGSFQETAGAISIIKAGTGAQTWIGVSNYTGSTTIAGGLLTVDLLADSGTDSAIGKGSTTAATDLVFTGTGGLVYSGNVRDGGLTTDSVSSATNRLFTLSGTALTLSSTVSNDNSISFSNTGDIDYGGSATAKLITLTGTSQGGNNLSPRITDNGTNVVTVLKTGTGVWELGGGVTGNTYSGTTTITQGFLIASDGQGLSSNSNLIFDGGNLRASGTLNRSLGGGAGEMQFLAPAANTAQFSGGFSAGSSKLTVTFGTTVNPTWGTGGFIDNRDGFMLQGSQARAQGATGSVAISEVDIAGDFSLGTASAAGASGLTFTVAQNSATVTGLASTAGFVVGQSFTGTNIPSGAYIVSINSATSLTLSANTANVGGTAGTFADGAMIANSLRTIRVDDNTDVGSDFATISGVISGDAGTGLRKVGVGILSLTGANTYSGETNVNQGTLVVKTLGNSAGSGGTSVGTEVNANLDGNAITLGNGGTGAAILEYVGLGETSDRKIRLNSTDNASPGIQIHADGVGALILTNVANDMLAGAKVLNLRGVNASGNMITSQLSDFGGALSLVVDGSATWLLTNTSNNYTGNTTVGGGALGIISEATLGASQLVLSNGSIFASGGDLTFATQTVQLASGTTAGITGDYSVTLTNPLNVLQNSTTTAGLNNGIVDGELLTLNAGATADFLTANRTWQVGGPGDTIINGAITTSTSFFLNLAYSGAGGTLTLSGAANDNTALGGTNTLSAGTLILDKVGAFGTTGSTFSFGSGTLQATSDANGVIDTAAVTLSGNGTVGGTSTIELKGVVTNSGGSRIVTNDITAPGKTFLISGDVRLSENTTSRTLTLQGSGDTVITGAIVANATTATGAGVLQKRGTGTLTLSNTGNLYTGGTVIDGGTVLLGAGDVIPNTGTVTIRQLIGQTTSGALDLKGFSDTIAALTLGATATDATNAGQTPSIIDTVGGGLLTLGSNVTYQAGTATFENGTALISANIGLGSASRTFTINDGAETTDLLVSGAISNGGTTGRAITKNGNGVMVLSNSLNSYTGGTVIDAGTIQLGANNVLPNTGTVTIRRNTAAAALDGVLDINGFTDTIPALSMGNTTTTAANAGQTPSVIDSVGGGFLILGGNYTYNVGTTGAGNENGQATISANVTLNGNRTFTVNDSPNAAVDTLISGNIGQDGTTARQLIKAGLGVLELNGVNTYTGATTVNAGTLLVTGSITGSTTTVNSAGTLGGTGTTGAVVVAGTGIISPGSSPGTLKTGDFDMAVTTTTLKLEIGGTAITDFDRLDVTGTVTLGGSLDVSLFGAYTGNVTDTFLVILNDGGEAVGGTFFNDVGGVIASIGDPAVTWGVNYMAGDGNDVQLTLLTIPEPNSLAMLAGSLGMAVGLQRFRRRTAR